MLNFRRWAGILRLFLLPKVIYLGLFRAGGKRRNAIQDFDKLFKNTDFDNTDVDGVVTTKKVGLQSSSDQNSISIKNQRKKWAYFY